MACDFKKNDSTYLLFCTVYLRFDLFVQVLLKSLL